MLEMQLNLVHGEWKQPKGDGQVWRRSFEYRRRTGVRAEERCRGSACAASGADAGMAGYQESPTRVDRHACLLLAEQCVSLLHFLGLDRRAFFLMVPGLRACLFPCLFGQAKRSRGVRQSCLTLRRSASSSGWTCAASAPRMTTGSSIPSTPFSTSEIRRDNNSSISFADHDSFVVFLVATPPASST